MTSNLQQTFEDIRWQIEREIEWPMTDFVSKKEIADHIVSIYRSLSKLEAIADEKQASNNS